MEATPLQGEAEALDAVQKQMDQDRESLKLALDFLADEEVGTSVAKEQKIPREFRDSRWFKKYPWKSGSSWGVSELRYLNVDFKDVHDPDEFLNFKKTSSNSRPGDVDYREEDLQSLLKCLVLTPAEYELAMKQGISSSQLIPGRENVHTFYRQLTKVVNAYAMNETEIAGDEELSNDEKMLTVHETASDNTLTRLVRVRKNVPVVRRVSFADEVEDLTEQTAAASGKQARALASQTQTEAKQKKKAKDLASWKQIMYEDIGLFPSASRLSDDSKDSQDMSKPDDEAYTRSLAFKLLEMILDAADVYRYGRLICMDVSSVNQIKIYGAPGTLDNRKRKLAQNDGYIAFGSKVNHKNIGVPLCNIECKGFATSRGVPNQVKLCSQVLAESIAIQDSRSQWVCNNPGFSLHADSRTVFSLVVHGRRASMIRLEFSNKYQTALIHGHLEPHVNIVMERSTDFRLDKPEQLREFVTLVWRFIRQLVYQIEHEGRIV